MSVAPVAVQGGKAKAAGLAKRESLPQNLRRHWPLYLMALPGIIFFIVFRYIPLAGTIIAFKDYSVFQGFFDSPWVGFKHFQTLFHYHDFQRVFFNTLILGFCRVFFFFPVPIVLAILINELIRPKFKKVIQTVFYIPHFFSWVIIAGLTFDVLSMNGIVNQALGFFGVAPIIFMQDEAYFRPIFIATSIWRDAGWGTIVYLAAIAGIDPQVYESAVIDGAGKLRQIVSITIPLLFPTILTLFLLSIGQFLELGFDHVYNLLTPMTYSVGDTIDTYVFRAGIQQAQYSYTTAVGVFQSVIGFAMVFTFNKISKKMSDGGGLW